VIYTVEITDGKEIWKNQQGLLHREDGPAVVYSDGTREWYRNDQLHREDGPAVVFPDGRKYWYRNDRRHREDGPAIIYPNGRKWYLHGEQLSEEEFLRRTAGTKDNTDYSGRVVEIDGIQYELKKLEKTS
jgi:hypothetical protein